ncbi:Na+/H+ antiporter NhaC family protein [Paenibacillus thermotolerans]|uniref:Na+/H+ antiporter NhaC family protein n=1 Tax=Paenibacillus thermotolerans TaxID=3027807 RepID=UPI002367AA31|nr:MULTISPECIES: Na+/H+ antiporter NhaC family protein [unclassified Paenibacillus]
MKTWKLGVVVLLTIAGLAAAYAVKIPLVIGFCIGLIALAVTVMKDLNIGWRSLIGMMKEGVGHTLEVVWILLLVGLLIPAWTASGTISYLVDAGLRLLYPDFLLTFGFLFSAVIALTLGTSTGTLSAVGIPLMGVAAHIGVPLPMMAGALVSGAFVGDRTSPFSSAHRLTAASAGIPAASLFRVLLPTSTGAFVLATAAYVLLDWFGEWGGSSAVLAAGGSGGEFVLSPLLAIPPVILLLSIIFRLETKYAFMLTIGSGIILGVLLQGGNAADWLGWLWQGYEAANSGSVVIHGKGIADMLDLVALIALAGAYNGILEKTNLIKPIVRKLLGGENTKLPSMTVRAGLFGLGLGFVSCTQTLPIMMTGRNLSSVWTERYSREHLARVTADTSLLFAAMVPWNMLAILCGTIVGVPVEQYAIFACFVWFPPLLTLGYSVWSERRGIGVGAVSGEQTTVGA